MLLNLLKGSIVATALVLIFIFFILPIKLPHKIETTGKVIPAKQWVLSIANNGQIVSHIQDNQSGINHSFFFTEFDRGDAVRFHINKNILKKFIVFKGDTIGTLYSNQLIKQLANLEGELLQAKASLSLNTTGEKQSVIKAAEEKLLFEQKKAEEQKRILARLKALWEKDLISKEEYEIAQNQADLDDINIKIAKAQLESAKTGVKPEQIELINSQVQTIENEITVLKKRLSDYLITSPITGSVNQFAKKDTILVVSDTSSYLIVMPVNIEERAFFKDNLKIKAVIPIDNEIVESEILHIDNNVEILRGKEIIFAKAIVKSKSKNLLPGIFVKCQIQSEPVSIKNRISTFLNELLY